SERRAIMKDEARLALEQLLSGGIVHIRAAYRKALSDGMEKPIVAVIDARDPKGRKILEGLTGTEAVGQPAWLIPQYRNAWIVTGRTDVGREGQQQVLRAAFPDIRSSVKDLVGRQMDWS